MCARVCAACAVATPSADFSCSTKTIKILCRNRAIFQRWPHSKGSVYSALTSAFSVIKIDSLTACLCLFICLKINIRVSPIEIHSEDLFWRAPTKLQCRHVYFSLVWDENVNRPASLWEAVILIFCLQDKRQWFSRFICCFFLWLFTFYPMCWILALLNFIFFSPLHFCNFIMSCISIIKVRAW